MAPQAPSKPGLKLDELEKEPTTKDDLNSSGEEDNEDQAAKQRELDKKYGLKGPEAFWEAYNNDTTKLDLDDPDVCEAIGLGWQASDEGYRPPEAETLKDALRAKQLTSLETCDMTMPWAVWIRRQQCGCRGTVTFVYHKSLEQLDKEQAEKEQAKQEQAKQEQAKQDQESDTPRLELETPTQREDQSKDFDVNDHNFLKAYFKKHGFSNSLFPGRGVTQYKREVRRAAQERRHVPIKWRWIGTYNAKAWSFRFLGSEPSGFSVSGLAPHMSALGSL